jgi:transcription elongation GreA/GreB family factor
MPRYSFLQHDYQALLEQKELLERRLKEVGQELKDAKTWGGISTSNNGDEVVPDTAAEQAFSVIAKQLETVCTLLRSAQVIKPPRFPKRVCLGSQVTVRESKGATARYIIGSYRIYRPRNHEISYASDLAQILIGAEEGEMRKGTINGRVRMFEILEILSAEADARAPRGGVCVPAEDC